MTPYTPVANTVAKITANRTVTLAYIVVLILVAFTYTLPAKPYIVTSDYGKLLVSQLKYFKTSVADTSLSKNLQKILANATAVETSPGTVHPDTTLWLHWRVVSVHNRDAEYVLRFDKTYSHSIAVWHVRLGIPTSPRISGMGQGIDQRDISSTTPAIRIDVFAKDTIDVIARISGETSKIIAQTPVFLSRDDFGTSSRNEHYLNGLFFGLVAALLVYNLFVYFSTKERAYLAYVLNTFATAIWMSAFVSLPNTVLPNWFGENNIQILYIASSFAAALGTWFVTELLKTSTFVPRLHRVMMVFVGFCCLYGITMFFTTKAPYTNISNILGIVQTTLCTTAGIIGIRKHQREARVFLIAYAVLLTSLFYWTAGNLGLQLHWFDGFTALRIGTAIELVVLSMLLADKLNTMRSAHEEAQRKALEAELYRLRTVELEQANQLSDKLLLNILPENIATRMKAGEERIADLYENAVVLFADIVGFTTWSANLGPAETVEYLDIVFSAIDKLAQEYGVEKIKTIGDCYMAVCGVTDIEDRSLQRTAEFAIQLRDLPTALPYIPGSNQERLRFRIGMDCGAVVAGVIGRSKFTFDLWGDVVNMASRMESHGTPDSIHCTKLVQETLATEFEFSEPIDIHVKGKGILTTFYLQHQHISQSVS